MPVLLQNEHRAVIAYLARAESTAESGGEHVALVSFDARAIMFGPPSDETIRSHPLYSRGLEPYAAFEVERSSWIRQLEKRNAVHPGHNPKRYLEGRQHIILTFHDSTFECVCLSYAARVIDTDLPLSSLLAAEVTR